MTIHRVRLMTIGVVLLLVIGATLVVLLLSTPRNDPRAAVIDSEAVARAKLLDAELMHGPLSLEYADAAYRLAFVLLRDPSAHRVEGKELSRRVLAIREAQCEPEHDEVALALEGLAIWLWHSAEYAAERPLVERALRMRERAEPLDEILIIGDLHLLSECLRAEGDYGRALQVSERAGQLILDAYGPVHYQSGLHWHYLAFIQAEIGDREAAIASAERAVRIRQELDSPKDLAKSLNVLGGLLIDKGDLRRAEDTLERARAIWLAASNADETETDFGLTLLGVLYAARHDYARAAATFAQIVVMRSAVLGPDHPAVARPLAQLGAAQGHLGDHAAARASLRGALYIQQRRSQPSLDEWGDASRELALLDASDGRFDAALTEALEAERLTRKGLRVSALGLSEREALAQARARIGGLDLAWTWASEREARGDIDDRAVSALVDEAIGSRALVLDTLATRQRILALHQDEETTTMVETLRRAQQRLTQFLMEDSAAQSSEAPERHLSVAQADADRAERALADKSRAFRQERRRGNPGLADVQAALPRGSALVSYFRHQRVGVDDAAPAGAAYVASILTADGTSARIVPLGSANEIDAAIHAWGDLVSRDPRPMGVDVGEAKYRDAARRLAGKIWDPIAPLLAGAELVFIVPDAALHAVNFATLVTPRREFLVEEGISFQYLTAERDLIGFGEQRASGLGVLALGDPAYGVALDSGARRFDRLPGSRQEAEQVATPRFARERTQLLLGDAASESEFRRLAPSFRVLHIATHAFFETAGPNAGNPLRFAGLAMAGANRGWKPDDPSDADDGILTAEEIALLDLQGVEWAVLSACATGQGALVPGEGVLGLRRAFQIAGAHTLIVSLWPVEDDATRDWMKRLYAARADGETTVDAVRDASRGVLEEQRRTGRTTHPYFWGGFVSIGDWR